MVSENQCDHAEAYKFTFEIPLLTEHDYLSITRGLERNAEGEGKMSGDEKSTDPSISVAERKAPRSREAEEAIAEHESAQKAFS